MQYNNGNGNVTIDFNICDYSFRKCPDNAPDFANVINENNTCNHLSSQYLSDVKVDMIDSEQPDLGLTLLFSGGNMCNATNKFELLVQLNCDQYNPKTSYNLDTSSLVNPCSPTVILSSKEACPKLTLGTLWTFFNVYYSAVGLLMMSLGLFLMILGGKYYSVTMFIAG